MINIHLIASNEMVFEVKKVPDLTMPASISALRVEGSPGILNQGDWENYAVEILQTSILWLLALKQIEILKVSIGRSLLSFRFQKFTSYLLVEEKNKGHINIGGIEGEIIKLIPQRETHRKGNRIFPGAFVDKVIWSLVGSFQAFPSHEVIHFVQIEAQKGGWGISHGLASPQFRLAPERLAEFVREQEKSRSWVEAFVADYPDFNRELTTQIRKGLRSRMTVHIWDNV